MAKRKRIGKPGSYWNYRLMAHEGADEIYFEMHEVHYKNDKPKTYTLNPITVGGENIKAVKWSLNRMKEALKKPILWYGKKFPAEYQGYDQNRHIYLRRLNPKQDTEIFTVKQWDKAVKRGSFTRYDGHGYWVRNGKRSTDMVFHTPPLDATHVTWFNK